MSNQDPRHRHSKSRIRLYVVVGLCLGFLVVAGILLGLLLPRDDDNKTNMTDKNNFDNDSKPPDTTMIDDFESSAPSPTIIARMGSFQVLKTVPHDTSAFTQGLQLVPDNPLQYFESTGLYGQSSVRIADLETGQVLQQRNLEDIYFGEGLTYFNGKLIQITWKEDTAFVYNSSTLELLDSFSYSGNTNGEGWGITYVDDRKVFFVSDGSRNIHTWDGMTFDRIETRQIQMRSRVRNDDPDSDLDNFFSTFPLNEINELEWDTHSDTLLANVWQDDSIYRIDVDTGDVVAFFDLSSLFRPNNANVLNGIAITSIPDEIWVTGKLWPNMYLIRLTDT